MAHSSLAGPAATAIGMGAVGSVHVDVALASWCQYGMPDASSTKRCHAGRGGGGG